MDIRNSPEGSRINCRSCGYYLYTYALAVLCISEKRFTDRLPGAYHHSTTDSLNVKCNIAAQDLNMGSFRRRGNAPSFSNDRTTTFPCGHHKMLAGEEAEA